MKDQTKLYHYCSIDSFFHIINSKSIWLSNSSQMNDSYENIWIEKYFNLIREEFKETKYNDLINCALDIYKLKSNPSFIFCLSAHKDILSQWRAYSNDGSGVAIGFNMKNLDIKKRIPSPNENAQNTLGLVKIEYSEIEQKRQILDLLKIIKENFTVSNTLIEQQILNVKLGKVLIDLGLIFKNPSFEEEKEWRIIHTPTENYKNIFDKLSDLKFRLSNNKILTYFQYNFKEDFNSKLINEIVIGPKCKMSYKEIKLFLEKNNLGNSEITYSKSTYR